MPVYVIDTLKPKNGLDFPIVEAVDVAVEGYSSLADAVSHFATDTAIAAINTALDLKADKTTTTGLQNQINEIITPVTQDAEVQNARVDADGNSHYTLKERLDLETLSNVNDSLHIANGEIPIQLTGWEPGTIDGTTGEDPETINTKFARTSGYLKMDTDKIYRCYPCTKYGVPNNPEVSAYFYDASHNYISTTSITGATFKADGPYARFVYYYTNTPIDVDLRDARMASVVIANTQNSKNEYLEDSVSTIFDGGLRHEQFVWEHGLINMTTGQDNANKSRKYARTIGYYDALDSEYVLFDYSALNNVYQVAKLTIYYYDASRNFVKAEAVEHERIQILYPYYRLVYYYQNTPVDVDIEDAKNTEIIYRSTIKDNDREDLENCLFVSGNYKFDDIIWKPGLINMTTGQDNPNIQPKFAKTVGYFKTPAIGKAIYFTVPDPVVNTTQLPALTIYYYDEDKNYIGNEAADNRERVITAPYFRLVYYYKEIPVDVDMDDAGLTYYTYTPSIKVPISLETTLTRNKYIAIGDSITWGHLSGDGTGSGRATDPYPAVVGRNLGLDVTYGARTGSGWVHPSGTTTAVTIVDSTDCSGYNLATLAFGTNDWYGNIPMGTLSDTGTTTIIGAMKHCIEKILADNPSICLIIITPINAKNLNAVDGAKTNQGNYRYNTPNTQGITLEEICAAEVQVAEYYGIPCIDNAKGSIVNRQNTANGSIFIDTLHPTNDFYKTLGQYYSGRIGEYFRGYSVD